MGADTLPLRDVFATLVSGSLALALVKGLETLAAQGTLRQVFQFLSGKNPLPCRSFALTDAEQLICRKIVHMSTGPLFVLTWPLFRCLLTNGQKTSSFAINTATLQMLHAAQCRIICPLVCCIRALLQWCEVGICSMSSTMNISLQLATASSTHCLASGCC